MDNPKKLEEGYGDVKQVQVVKEEDVTKSFHAEKDADAGETDQKSVIKDRPMEQKLQEENHELTPVIVKPKSKRVASLDAFRGLTIVLMILVDDAGGVYPRIDHSPWNGCTLADFVLPFFLFIVGVAIALALKRVPEVNAAVKKIILRTLKLFLWGLLLQGGYSHAPNNLTYGVDMKSIRWCGILQRIALVYLVVALIETFTTNLRPTTVSPDFFSIFVAYKWQWLGGFVSFLIYMIAVFTLYVPDWSFVALNSQGVPERYTVQCGMRGHFGPACNAVGYVDRQVWGINHLGVKQITI